MKARMRNAVASDLSTGLKSAMRTVPITGMVWHRHVLALTDALDHAIEGSNGRNRAATDALPGGQDGDPARDDVEIEVARETLSLAVAALLVGGTAPGFGRGELGRSVMTLSEILNLTASDGEG